MKRLACVILVGLAAACGNNKPEANSPSSETSTTGYSYDQQQAQETGGPTGRNPATAVPETPAQSSSLPNTGTPGDWQGQNKRDYPVPQGSVAPTPGTTDPLAPAPSTIPQNTQSGDSSRGMIGTSDRATSDADKQTLNRVRDAIATDTTVADLGHGITIVVETGKVTLTGDVPTARDKQKLGDKVKKVNGVKTVQNQLHVPPAEKK